MISTISSSVFFSLENLVDLHSELFFVHFEVVTWRLVPRILDSGTEKWITVCLVLDSATVRSWLNACG